MIAVACIVGYLVGGFLTMFLVNFTNSSDFAEHLESFELAYCYVVWPCLLLYVLPRWALYLGRKARTK